MSIEDIEITWNTFPNIFSLRFPAQFEIFKLYAFNNSIFNRKAEKFP